MCQTESNTLLIAQTQLPGAGRLGPNTCLVSTPNGALALVANRGAGTVSVLKIDANTVEEAKRDITVGIRQMGSGDDLGARRG